MEVVVTICGFYIGTNELWDLPNKRFWSRDPDSLARSPWTRWILKSSSTIRQSNPGHQHIWRPSITLFLLLRIQEETKTVFLLSFIQVKKSNYVSRYGIYYTYVSAKKRKPQEEDRVMAERLLRRRRATAVRVTDSKAIGWVNKGRMKTRSERLELGVEGVS